MSKPAVIYFDMRGRGEFIRLVLVEAGVDFEDRRVTSIADLKPKLPFGQVPAAEIDGKTYAQSFALTRYFARKHGLYGKTLEDGLVADMVLDECIDLFIPIIGLKNATEEQKVKVVTEHIPKHLGYLDNLLTKNGGEYFAGVITYVDLVVFEMADSTLAPKFADIWKQFPNLEAHRARIAARPNIAAWIAKRKPE
eukprot:TRINITY_DN398_c0_g1_i2.p1 TRINITY_DN398_c0_g1~~TRINITY_DN398_c0_g1_i2.p1  ORF type:complete len:195 (+),score=21.16 TRINITY_DN398_c0_g1_i2:45-629(+)